MARVYGRINGKGKRVYIKTIYTDEIRRLVNQGNVMYTSNNTYTNLTYEVIT